MSWKTRCFQSGTTIVTNDEPGPHFYVYGPQDSNEDDQQANRHKVCEEIRDYMNGGKRPKWLDDMDRRREDSAEGLDGTSIHAVGPIVDRDPPNRIWGEDASIDAKNNRARLMDRLFRAETPQS